MSCTRNCTTPGIQYDRERGQGTAFFSFAYGVAIVEVEGAFVQGLGWLTGEEVLYRPDGAVLTVGPSTYKIPSVGDVPLDLRVTLLEHQPQEGTIGGSKAVGEPPLMLAIAVLGALEEAIGAFGEGPVDLAVPATGEAILRAVETARRR